MHRFQVEHLIREISQFTGEKEFLIVGSQSIHGMMDHPPDVFKNSIECDFLKNDAEWIKKVRETFGQNTEFQRINQYHADPIGLHVVKMPPGWEERLLTYKIDDITCKVPHILDLAACKLMAGREKDLVYVNELVSWSFVKKEELVERVRTMGLPDDPNVQQKLLRFDEFQSVKSRVQRRHRSDGPR